MKASLSIVALLSVAMLPTTAQATPLGTLEEARAAMVRNPREVLGLVDKAIRELGSQQGTSAELVRARADWLRAEASARLGETDKAEQISQRALTAVARLEPQGQLHADILMTRGGIALDANRVRDAFELFRRAHDIFHKLGHTRSQAIALQNIGTIYSFAGDQRSVLRYYAQAQEVHQGDTALAQAAANNLGTAYRELRDYAKADAQFRRAITLARELNSPVLEARALNNLASVALLRGRLDEANGIADRGLRISRSGDAAEWAPFLWGVKAQVALARGNVTAAIGLLERTFAGADLNTTPFYFRDFHESASKAYREAGNLELALGHLNALKRLDDEAREIRSSTNTALAAAQFDFSSQELRIARLREEKLARDVKIERARARQQLILLAAAFVLLIVLTVAFFWIRRSRNQTRAANRELASTNSQLDKALKAKSEFLATTSHEIRTPLNGILGMTQLLLGRRALDPAVRDQVRVIDSAGTTMKAIVDDILDMSQIEQGRVHVERAPVDLHALVGDVAGLWRATAQTKNLDFQVDLANAPGLIEEDERKLRQIGFNLLSNAVKFTRAGSVRLRVFTQEQGGQQQLVMEVQDTGIGIASDQLAAIFEPFQQADGSTSREFGGTGLGLAISTKLAQALDGSITVTSEPGVGSTFALVLPLRLIERSAAVPVSSEPARSLAEARIAVIESNPLLASMIEACLSDAREVTLCDTVQELPARGVDVIVAGEDVTSDEIADVRKAIAGVSVIAWGTDENPGADAAVERRMPPLNLPAAIEDLLANAIQPAQAA
jgi:signal transduction histidine kinase